VYTPSLHLHIGLIFVCFPIGGMRWPRVDSTSNKTTTIPDAKFMFSMKLFTSGIGPPREYWYIARGIVPFIKTN
jgi:hypothetical protein